MQTKYDIDDIVILNSSKIAKCTFDNQRFIKIGKNSELKIVNINISKANTTYTCFTVDGYWEVHCYEYEIENVKTFNKRKLDLLKK